MEHLTGSYIDEKGRTRWRNNDWLGEKLKELADFLVIGGYEESHATRYPKLAHAISRYPVAVDVLVRENRLSEIGGIGPTITEIITQILATGTSAKFEEWAQHTPVSALELTHIPRLGAKTIRVLYAEYGIDSLAALKSALDSGALNNVPGLGVKMLETMRGYTAELPSSEA